MSVNLTDLPGVTVAISATSPANSTQTDTGVAFVCGLAKAGPIDRAVAVHSMNEFIAVFGARDTGSLLYDTCDVAFQSGASVIYVGRDAGPNPVNDTITLNDATNAASLLVSSIGPTDTGWQVAVTAGTVGGTFNIVVTDAAGNLLTASGNLTTIADAVLWGKSDGFVTVSASGTQVPAVAAAANMTGGNDDRASIDMTNIALRQAVLEKLFPMQLGPGQLAYPGLTNVEIHVALANAASRLNRVALLDMPDTANATTLAALRTSFLGNGSLLNLAETYVAHLADWQLVPGLQGAPTRTVPPSGFWVGLIAAQDAMTGNPNTPAAGAAGELTYSLGRTQPEWSDTDRNTLNADGVNVIRNVFGAFRIYGYRSGANPSVNQSLAWKEFSNVRMRMKIVYDLDVIGEDYIFSQLDGKGATIAAFHGACAGRMMTYYELGALFGSDATQAYEVVTASPVNTDATAAAQQLNVLIGAKFSPYAEKVYFGFTKQAITEG
jgi:hypothetical protein